MIIQLSHKEIYLGYFKYVKKLIENLTSGDSLIIKEDGCADSNGNLVLKFSRKFLNVIADKRDKGYVLKSAKVNYIVYWLEEGEMEEVKIVLPEVSFEDLG